MSYFEILKEYDFIENKEEFYKALLQRPTFFRINTIKDDKEKILKALRNYDDLEFEEVIDNHFVVKKGNISKKIEHLLGYVYIQDLASALVVKSFDLNENIRIVVDLCSSPGGKALLIASLLPNSLVIANDMNRIDSLFTNVQRMGALNVVITRCNAVFFPSLSEEIDLILADVPCSAESNLDDYENYNISKHYRFVDYISNLQYNILKRASEIASSKTQIIYSTCTFDPLENEYVIDKALKENLIDVVPINYDFSKFSISNGLKKYKDYVFDQSLTKTIRLNPFNIGGMFISKLKKSDRNDSSSTRSFCRIVPLSEAAKHYNLKLIDPEVIYKYLEPYGVDKSVVENLKWFSYKSGKSDIYVTSLNEFPVKEKGPLVVEHLGIKAFRTMYKNSSNERNLILKPTSTFITLLSRYVKKNYVELSSLDYNLLKRFLKREKIAFRGVNRECQVSEEFDQNLLNSLGGFVVVKFNDLILGMASLQDDYIVSLIPSNRANFWIEAMGNSGNVI